MQLSLGMREAEYWVWQAWGSVLSISLSGEVLVIDGADRFAGWFVVYGCAGNVNCLCIMCV